MPYETTGLLLNKDKASRKNVCLTGYNSKKPNYALSNFYKNTGDKGFWFKDPDLIHPIWFPTSEHYLHFQKLNKSKKEAIQNDKTQLNYWQNAPANTVLAAMSKTDNARRQNARKTITINDSDFKYQSKSDWTQWDKDKINVQLQINETKYQQSEEFRASIQAAIDLGKGLDNGGPIAIIEDTASAINEEKIWGSGPDGTGENILGNTQTATATMIGDKSLQITTQDLTKNTSPTPTSLPTLPVNNPQPMTAYKNAKSDYEKDVKLTLIAVRKNPKNKLGTTDAKLDTSEIVDVSSIDAAKLKALLSSSKATPAPATNAIKKGNIDSIVKAFKEKFPEGSGGKVEEKNGRTTLIFPAEDTKPAETVAKDFFTDLAKPSQEPFVMQQYVGDSPKDHYHFSDGKGALFSGSKEEIEETLNKSGDKDALKLFQDATKLDDTAEFRKQVKQVQQTAQQQTSTAQESQLPPANTRSPGI